MQHSLHRIVKLVALSFEKFLKVLEGKDYEEEYLEKGAAMWGCSLLTGLFFVTMRIR